MTPAPGGATYPSAPSIAKWLADQASRTPEAIAILALNHAPLTYKQLYAHIQEAVLTLHSLGIRRNDQVGIILPNGPEMAVAFLGVASGATAAPLNPACRAAEFEASLVDIQAKALIVQAGVDSPARAVARARGIPIVELHSRPGAEASLFTFSGERRGSLGHPEFARPGDVALLLSTSGTTSRPKLVPLTHASLFQSARNIQTTLALTHGDRCLNVMPLFHVHGLVGALLSSLVAGASVVCTPGCQLPQFFAWLETFRPTWYTAVPTMHRAVLSSARVHDPALPPTHSLRFIRSSSAPLPPKVMRELEQAFEVPVLEAYGMTEASHQICSNPLPPRERKEGSVGFAAGTEISIMDGHGHLLTSGEVGEIVIRGANVMVEYAANPGANEDCFSRGWFRTGDRGYLDNDGYLFIVGRLREIINRGGEKISPFEVDQVLLDHPAVAEAAAFAVPHATLGEDVVAAVVLKTEPHTTGQELQDFVAARLTECKVPRRIIIVDHIPRGTTGKIQRVGLAQVFAEELRRDPAAPTNDFEAAVASIYSEVLSIPTVGRHDNFFLLGGDSLRGTQVLSRVRSLFQVSFPIATIFRKSTVADLADEIARITAERDRAAVGALTPGLAAELRGKGVIFPGSRDKHLSLSFAQERLWFLDQLAPGSTVYNMSATFRVRGFLDLVALERSLNEVVRRHESLRTTFRSNEGLPHQDIALALTLALPVINLSDRPPNERETEARRLAAEESRRTFDLSRGPLLRMTLIRLHEDEHILFFNAHHIVFDGWSIGILFRELAVLYEAYSHGELSPLAELPIQYADYAAWQRRWLEGEVLQTQLSYWKRQLENISTRQLPTDRPRPAVQSFHGGKVSLTLSKDLTEGLKVLSRKEGVTLFMTLLAALQTLLHRFTGQDDIVVGAPIAGRNRTEIEGLIGCFINTLVLRADLSGNPSFRELLGRVRGNCLDAYAHQDVPFERLLEELRPERDLSRTTLVQVLLNMINVEKPVIELAGLTIEPLPASGVQSKFDMTIYVMKRHEALHFNLVYNADLFDQGRMAEMLRQYQTLLSQVVEHPAQSISAYSLLTERARKLLPNPGAPLAADWVGSVHERFSQQARRLPERLAVVDETDAWTYAELECRSNQLASYLLAKGIRAQDIVTVYADRSASFVWALLGVLKTGAAFVVLDPAYPSARLIDCLRAAKPHGWLEIGEGDRLSGALKGFVESLSCRVQLQIPSLSSARQSGFLEEYSTEAPAVTITSNDLAYVAFTSGSGGNPRGILGTHGPLSHFFQWHTRTFDLNESDRFSMLSGLSHDPCLRDIFTPLWLGATLCIPDATDIAPGRLAEWMKQKSISVAHLTPGMGEVLIAGAEAMSRENASLRHVFFGGDVLTKHLVSRIRQFASSATCINFYGATETPQAMGYFVVAHEGAANPDDGRADSRETIPLGQGIDDVQLLVLNASRLLAGVGELGEIYMRSPHLALGYLNDTSLTQARFMTNPFTGDAKDRLYRSGDLGRYLHDGRVEILGRSDRQIKIRGFRVEPGEIESALKQHPAVREAAVVGREDVEGDKRLVAYVVADRHAAPERELRRFVRRKLPDYMTPSAFIFLDGLPLTPNGKLDHHALPAPDRNRSKLEGSFIAPRTPIEEELAGIWAEVLRLERIGVNDNFFDLGGHSLLATQVIARARGAFQVDITLRDLFEKPTLGELAIAIAGQKAVELNGEGLSGTLAELESLSEEETRRLLLEQRTEWP